VEDFKPQFKSAPAPKTAEAVEVDDDEDTMSYFAKLAEDD
jgi:hypothetical protein